MKELLNYLNTHSIKGPCACANSAPTHPHSTAPHEQSGPTKVDLVFFTVACNPDDPPDAATLRNLIVANAANSDLPLDLLDGAEHDFFYISKWLGDQVAALLLMGLGTLLGLWTLRTPKNLAPNRQMPRQLEISLAESGYLTIQASTSESTSHQLSGT